MVTTREIAIARSVIYASLFDYPLTLEQLHHSLIESDQTRAGDSRGLRRQRAAAAISSSIATDSSSRWGAATSSPSGAGARRAADAFLAQHRLALRLICALPFTRLVALSGSIAHRNLEPDGDLDLFIVTRGPRVWTVTVMLLVLTKLLRRRRTICANFVLADSHLARRPAGSVHGEPGDPPEAAHRRRSARRVPRGQPVRRPLLSERAAPGRRPRRWSTCAAAGSGSSSACSETMLSAAVAARSRRCAGGPTRGTCGGAPARGARRTRCACSPTT